MLRIQREFGLDDTVAAVDLGEEILRAVGAPLHRAPERACCEQQGRMFRIGVATRPETAADIGANDAQLVLGHAKHFRELPAHRVSILRRAIQREAPVRELRSQRARLQRIGDHALVDDLHPDRVRGRRECGVARGGIAHAVERSDVAVFGDERFRPVHRCIGACGRGQVRIRRQRVPVDFDELGRVARLVAGLGDHHRHCVTYEADNVRSERVAWRYRHVSAAGALVHLRERHRQ